MYTALCRFYGFCVRLCTAFAYIFVRLLRMFVHGFCALAAFAYVHGFFCARSADFAYVYVFLCALIRFCVRIRVCLRVKRLFVYIYGFFIPLTSGDPILRVLWFVRSPYDSILRVRWFVRSPDDQILRVRCFVWRPDDPILRVRWFVESPCKRSWLLDYMYDPSEGSNLQVPLSKYLYIMIGLSGGYSLQGSVEFFIWWSSCDSPSDLTWSISYPTIFSRFIVRYYPGLFLVDLV